MSDLSLPDGWKLIRVGDVGKVVTGKTPPTNEIECWGGDIPFITPSDLNGATINSAGRSISIEGLKYCKPLPRGTVLVSCIGYIGKTALFDAEIAVSNQQINAVIPDEKIMKGHFFHYAINYMEKHLNDAASITTVPIINKSNFEAFHIPLPPLLEQCAIAATLRAVQDAHAARRRELAAERERKAALIEELFTCGLRGGSCKETEIGLMPENWNLTTLGALFDLQQGKQVSAKNRTGKSLAPFLRTLNVFWGRVDVRNLDEMDFTPEEVKRLNLQVGDLLICEGGEIGRTAIWSGKIPICCHQNHVHRLRRKPDQAVAPAFYMHWMAFAYLLRGIYKGYGNKTTIPNLPASQVRAFIVPHPDFSEQQQIADVLNACDAKIAALEAEAALHEELFRALLEDLMTGRLSALPLAENAL